MNKIRKFDTAQTPNVLQPDYGPGTAGVGFDVVQDNVVVNPSGTKYRIARVIVQANGDPSGSDHAASGTLWVNLTGPKLSINLGTYGTPDWDVITTT